MRGGSAQQTSSNPGERAKTVEERFCEASNAEREAKKRAGERRAATIEAEVGASKKLLEISQGVFYDVCLRQKMLAPPMMTASPNDVCLTAHWANIASLRPTGATSF